MAETPLPADEWFWEGNVQQAMIRYLRAQGWTAEHSTDTARGEHGSDIVARRDGKLLLVEVKGYPSVRYVKGTKAGACLNRPSPPCRLNTGLPRR